MSMPWQRVFWFVRRASYGPSDALCLQVVRPFVRASVHPGGGIFLPAWYATKSERERERASVNRQTERPVMQAVKKSPHDTCWMVTADCPSRYRGTNVTSLTSLSDILLDDFYTYTHTRLTALCQGLPGRAGTRKLQPIWILPKQETVSGSGISWAECKSAPCTRQKTTPAPHQGVSFLQAGCPSCHPTNSI